LPSGETTATAATGHAGNNRARPEALESSPEPATGAVTAAADVVPSGVAAAADVLTGLVTVGFVVEATVLVDDAELVAVSVVVTVLVDAAAEAAVVTTAEVAVVSVAAVGGESANAVATPTTNRSTVTTPAIIRPSGIHSHYCATNPYCPCAARSTEDGEPPVPSSSRP
jgi:hypothetical protein